MADDMTKMHHQHLQKYIILKSRKMEKPAKKSIGNDRHGLKNQFQSIYKKLNESIKISDSGLLDHNIMLTHDTVTQHFFLFLPTPSIASNQQ